MGLRRPPPAAQAARADADRQDGAAAGAERPRSYMAQDLRHQQLLECGLRLFASRSFVDVSIDDIADAAGTSKGLMYHYFGSKRAFYTEVVRYAAERLLEAIAPRDGRSGAENAEHGLHAYFAFVEAHADAYMALMQGGLGVDDLVQSILEDTRRRIVAEILARLGVTDPPGALRAAVRGWLGAVEATAIDWLAHRDVEIGALVEPLAASLFVQVAIAARNTHTEVALDPAGAERVVSVFARLGLHAATSRIRGVLDARGRRRRA